MKQTACDQDKKKKNRYGEWLTTMEGGVIQNGGSRGGSYHEAMMALRDSRTSAAVSLC